MKYKIAIIVTWFGKLPPYFSAWLRSAEYNETIDFIIFSDQEIISKKRNIIIYKTTLNEEIENYKKKVNQDINIKDAYKFCDCRLFFGLFYENLLKTYDFWGYCDIDLVFGNIRKFVTDDVLDNYDRIYQFGHLSLYRNNEQMKHIYELEGGIYSLEEIFQKQAKTTPEEHYGVNRICKKNKIKWYTKVDFADLLAWYPMRLQMGHGKGNYSHQIFVWRQGEAYRIYENGGEILEQELVYIHWQKKKPEIKCSKQEFERSREFVITAKQIIPIDNCKYTEIEMDEWNPPMFKTQLKQQKRKYMQEQTKKLLYSNGYTKKIWGRQLIYRIGDRFKWK